MPFVDEHNALELAFKNGFQSVYPAVVIHYQNDVNFKRPDSTIKWVAFFVIPGYGNTITLGEVHNLKRRPGLIQCNIYVPAFQGVGAARDIADKINTVFEDKDFLTGVPGEVIRVLAPSRIKPIGVRDGHYTESLTISYNFDSTL